MIETNTHAHNNIAIGHNQCVQFSGPVYLHNS